MARQVKGFLSYNEYGSRMTRPTEAGLRSTDLGRITIHEAQKKAWLHGVTLIVNGRIHAKRES